MKNKPTDFDPLQKAIRYLEKALALINPMEDVHAAIAKGEIEAALCDLGFVNYKKKLKGKIK